MIFFHDAYEKIIVFLEILNKISQITALLAFIERICRFLSIIRSNMNNKFKNTKLKEST